MHVARVSPIPEEATAMQPLPRGAYDLALGKTEGWRSLPPEALGLSNMKNINF